MRLQTLLPATVLSLLLSGASGCGGETTPVPQPAPVPLAPQSSGLSIERWFPLIEGHIYQYATRAEDGSEGLLVTTAKRAGATTGSLRTGTSDKFFQYLPDGVQVQGTQGAAYVLKQPLAVGTNWRGEHGGVVTITAVGASVQVPAGSYSGCTVTEERRGGDVPLLVSTTFCPDVGIVLLQAQSGGRNERAELRSYGPPVDLGPDGVRRVP